ncbi:MAG: general secretion pathway protein GspK [Betaproteobacteria bacterium]
MLKRAPAMRNDSGVSGLQRHDRGVALIIVLLVTALLIALVFEFAYGTRISLRASVNFRDSQRAYYLARSGVNFAGLLLSDNLKKGKPLDNIEQRDWQVVPIMTGSSDTELRVRWEDESGKINISSVVKPRDQATASNPALSYNRMVVLFTNRGVNQEILDRIDKWMTEQQRNKFFLLTEFHQFLSDEDFRKVQDAVTVSPVTQINVNTASADVLQSVGLSSGMAEMIVGQRNREPFKTSQEITDFLGPSNTMASGQLTYTSNVFKVNSFATVGGYTKQVEAVITRSTSGFTVNYWREL